MTPDTFSAIRKRLGLTQSAFAIALGYRSAKRENRGRQISDMESGHKIITPQIARLAEMFRRFGLPADFLGDGDI